MMNSVLSLAELAADMETEGFFGVISGNSSDSNQCGSNDSRGC